MSTTTDVDSAVEGPADSTAIAAALPLGATAVIYCEGQFGEQDGKTANGLVRYSDKYDILSVLDSRYAGSDAGMTLDGHANGIPVLADLAEAIAHAGRVPDYLICGLAPADVDSLRNSASCCWTASPGACTSSTVCTNS